MKNLFLFIFLMSFSCANPSNKVLEGKIVRIADGDTFTLLVEGNKQVKIRLNGIDAPEKKQDYYRVCKDALSDLLKQGNISVKNKGKDRYGRILGDVYINNEIYVNLEMIKQGMAWHYKKYSKDSSMAAAEVKARNDTLGLWSLSNAVAPWEFRKLVK